MQVSIRPLEQNELTAADQIFRLAFGTFRKLPNPAQYGGDMTFIKRWFTDPTAVFAAEIDGKLVGSNFASNWGSFGFFGPLTIHPDFWGQKIAPRLIEPVLECFKRWNNKQVGLFTFPNSPLHLSLYQKFDFYPRFLTAVMTKEVKPTKQLPQGLRYSELPKDKQIECLRSSQELTDAIYDGLDLEREIRIVEDQSLGDTLFLWDDKGLSAFAICHYGKGTEAGSNACYIKFAAIRLGAKAGQNFEQLLQECETLSRWQGASQLIGGVNTARQEAYQQMLAFGFRIDRLGIAMLNPNEPAFNRPGAYIIDDWR
ncbi:GNAT family N-acetyltransferase [Gloeothece verrucosa]|uniref:GCN5-related N-acetyltransferase n=1 Tax=Gloeothece verrucosa (strain PCC 7822) TaxID=497965 RepID=E0ULP0_GLOV7|nr:GNAT family N-acetyltransferase [Gloeothece verrucosa]ADN17870.1 GCN5-related N-acetyltransferase [Gloeothece verrucosa PCC 7822]